MLVLVFSADNWVPEYLPKDEIVRYKNKDYSKFYADCPGECKYVRSGRPYYISSGDEDYERFFDVK